MNNILLVTDGAWKGKTSKKAGSGFILHNYNNKNQHEFMYELSDYEILDIQISKSGELLEGTYRVELINIVDNLHYYKVGESIELIFTVGELGKYPQTNNRAEYIAYILGMILVNIIYPNWEINLISDSMLLINTIQLWLHNWVKKGILGEKKNPDLLKIIYKLKYPNYLTHVNSHLTPQEYNKLSDIMKYYSRLNDRADALANQAIQ